MLGGGANPSLVIIISLEMFKFSFRVRGLNLGSVIFKKAGYICYSHWLLILPLPSKVLDWGSWGQILRPMKTESCLKSKDAEYTQVPWEHCTLLRNQATTRVSPKSPFSALWGWIPSWSHPGYLVLCHIIETWPLIQWAWDIWTELKLR